MGLREEIENGYTDAYGLVTPGPYLGEHPQGSDNGTLFTSEYYLLLKNRGESQFGDTDAYNRKIMACVILDKVGHMLTRAPGDQDPDVIDNYHGVLHACVAFEIRSFSIETLRCLHFRMGCLNNNNPGEWTLQSFFYKFPQLIACFISARGEGRRWYHAPLYWYAALVIATSCMRTPADKDHTDARRLAWHLIHTVKKDSWLCRQAAKIWYKRLYGDYGNAGMGTVNGFYYHGKSAADPHPIVKFWRDYGDFV